MQVLFASFLTPIVPSNRQCAHGESRWNRIAFAVGAVLESA